MNPITMIFGLIAIAVMAPLAVHFLNSQSRQTMATVAALQMARIEKAAQGYITTYAATIEANATATNPATITIPMLVNTGYLPNGFQQNNPYGQTWEVQVLQPSAGQLQALVLSVGGQTVPTRDLGKAAQIAGASGGVIGGGSGNAAVPGCSGGQACGVYAGWKVSTNGYQAQPGHLAALIEYSNGQVQNDYLYRTAVPGQPQLNTMQTNLDMGDNNINNANAINAQSETLAGGQPNGQPGALQIGSNYFYGDSQNAAVRTPGGFYVQNQNASGPASIDEVDNINASGNITTPNAVQGGYVNSTGDVNAQYNSTANNAFAMDNGSWYVNNAGDSSQSGNAYVGGQLTANYDELLGTAGGSAYINQPCSQTGALATNANGTGQLLACQYNGQGFFWENAQGGGGMNSGVAGTYQQPGVYTSNTFPGREGICIDGGFDSAPSASLVPIYWGYTLYGMNWIGRYAGQCYGGVIWAQ